MFDARPATETFGDTLETFHSDTNDDLSLPEAVDALTLIQTQIAVLEAREAGLKKQLVASGLKEVCGSTTRVMISHIAAGTTVSWKDLATSFKPTDEQLAKFSKKKEASVQVRVYGYN